MNRSKPVAILLLLATLGACVPSAASQQPQRPAPPPLTSQSGLQAVLGRTARMLEAQFGTPDLDVREGRARKLQFSSPVCVLDTYLYPPSAGGEPVVTHLDARLPDGRDMDRASCIAALQQARLKR